MQVRSRDLTTKEKDDGYKGNRLLIIELTQAETAGAEYVSIVVEGREWNRTRITDIRPVRDNG